MTTKTLTRAKTPRPAMRPRADGSSLEQALDPIKGELEAVTQRMLSVLSDPVAKMVVYLITAGGKRLRPALVLLAGAAGPSPNQPALIDAATTVELIHTATLIHDDIIDGSPLRRAQPTFHARWGVERAVLMGDYLYATAFTVLARLRRPELMEIMADVCRQLSRGELREVEARYRLDLTEADYREIIRDKTASLIGGCCRCGAVLGGGSPDAVERWTAFGIHFGLAFQVIDDCLDLIGDQRQLGKSIHADLDKGALSLPMIYLTQALSPRACRRLFAPLRPPALSRAAGRRAGTRATDPAFLARVARAAEAAGSLAKAQAHAAGLIRKALKALDGLPMNGVQDACQSLTAYAISRRS